MHGMIIVEVLHALLVLTGADGDTALLSVVGA